MEAFARPDEPLAVGHQVLLISEMVRDQWVSGPDAGPALWALLQRRGHTNDASRVSPYFCALTHRWVDR